jgi:hypothetical protein
MLDSKVPSRSVPTAVALTLLAAGAVCTAAQAAEGDETAVTIYSAAAPGAIPADLYRPLPGAGVPDAMSVPGHAMVRHERPLRLQSGRSTVQFTDVAALIDPTTVTFTSLTEPRTRVVEQNFQFDLVSTQKLLLKYIDKPIVVERTVGTQSQTVSGTLLSAVDGLVLKTNEGIQTLNNYSSVRFPELPGGLNTRPTLVWDIQSPTAGEQRARVTYQTGGITWWADYNLIFTEGKTANAGTLDLSAWVSIINQSGASYPESKLKLIAGNVNRVQPAPAPMEMQVRATRAFKDAEDAGFEQKAFSEFHLYTLGRRTTLPNNSTKQIELFDQAKQVPAKKTLVYSGLNVGPYYFPNPVTDRSFGTESNRKVDVFLEFRNEKKVGLGMPLPSGRIRVSQVDTADGTLEFVGEDSIDHTPKDENVRVKLGSAFDVVGERRQTDFTVDTNGKWMEEAVEIKLRNHKDQPVDIIVKENLYRWSTWTVTSKSHDFTKEDARTIHFPVRVASDGETVVKYRVRYTW